MKIILLMLLAFDSFARTHIIGHVKPMNSTENCLFRRANLGQPIDTVRSLKDGQWTDPAVWSVGRVPTRNDVVFLVHTVTIPSGVLATVQGLLYDVNGHLSFEDVNAKLQFYPRFRIKKVIFTASRYYSSTVYNYNNQGLLVNLVGHGGSSSLAEDSPGSTSTLTYNEQGQLVRIISPSSSTTTRRLDYIYDNNGHIISVQDYNDADNPGTYTLTYTYTLEYSTGKFPVKVTNTYAPNPNNYRVEQYTYSNGNVVTEVVTEHSEVVIDNPTNTYNYSATASPNPFYGLFTGPPDFTTYSIDLVEGVGSVYIDTYDSNGYIVKQSKKNGSGGIDTITTFEYEMY